MVVLLGELGSLSHSHLGRTLPDVVMSVLNFQFRYLNFFGKKEKLCTASFLNGSQLLLDGAIEIYHILTFFPVVIVILTLRSLRETFSDILVKMSVPISFLNLGYYRVGKVF